MTRLLICLPEEGENPQLFEAEGRRAAPGPSQTALRASGMARFLICARKEKVRSGETFDVGVRIKGWRRCADMRDFGRDLAGAAGWVGGKRLVGAVALSLILSGIAVRGSGDVRAQAAGAAGAGSFVIRHVRIFDGEKVADADSVFVDGG